MDPFVAEIRIFPFNFAPRGWAWCDGQLLPLSQNTALFSLLGTTYGGDGKTTFALPDLRGRVPMHPGQGPGLSPRNLGESIGSATVTLTAAEMPYHSHTVPCSSTETGLEAASTVSTETGSEAASPVFARTDSDRPPAYSSSPPNVNMAPEALTPAGGGMPHNNMSPYLACNFCIALQGVYPPRS